MQTVIAKGSPYKQNFQNYGTNIATSDFKRTLLKGMGENVKCVISTNKENKQSIQTFSIRNTITSSVDHQHLSSLKKS